MTPAVRFQISLRSGIAQRAIIDREYLMSLAWRAIQVIVIRDRTLNYPHFSVDKIPKP
ncbi:hypothetical protein [Microcoleus sp.]|uniref:hypothetical protein n=1 Tax=Microcoleus sp. TaxID=44472 RepID=UPI00403EBEB0